MLFDVLLRIVQHVVGVLWLFLPRWSTGTPVVSAKQDERITRGTRDSRAEQQQKQKQKQKQQAVEQPKRVGYRLAASLLSLMVLPLTLLKKICNWFMKGKTPSLESSLKLKSNLKSSRSSRDRRAKRLRWRPTSQLEEVVPVLAGYPVEERYEQKMERVDQWCWHQVGKLNAIHLYVHQFLASYQTVRTRTRARVGAGRGKELGTCFCFTCGSERLLDGLQFEALHHRLLREEEKQRQFLLNSEAYRARKLFIENGVKRKCKQWGMKLPAEHLVYDLESKQFKLRFSVKEEAEEAGKGRQMRVMRNFYHHQGVCPVCLREKPKQGRRSSLQETVRRDRDSESKSETNNESECNTEVKGEVEGNRSRSGGGGSARVSVSALS